MNWNRVEETLLEVISHTFKTAWSEFILVCNSALGSFSPLSYLGSVISKQEKPGLRKRYDIWDAFCDLLS